jgi:hypothetical protein
MIPKKPVLGLDPKMDAGFPPARSRASRFSPRELLRRAKTGRKRSCAEQWLRDRRKTFR